MTSFKVGRLVGNGIPLTRGLSLVISGVRPLVKRDRRVFGALRKMAEAVVRCWDQEVRREWTSLSRAASLYLLRVAPADLHTHTHTHTHTISMAQLM